MWIDYKEVENLLAAEMWKSLLEGEGLPAKILPVDGILEWSETSKFRLMVPVSDGGRPSQWRSSLSL